jgi:hypothetical protein
MTRFLEGLIARAVDPRPTAAPPPRPRLLAPMVIETPPLRVTGGPSPAFYRAADPTMLAAERRRDMPRPAASATRPDPSLAFNQSLEPLREAIAAPRTAADPAAPRQERGEAPPVAETAEIVVVEASKPAAAEAVGPDFETAVARLFTPEPPRPATTSPVPAPIPSVVTSIVIGRVELTAAPAGAPPRAASSTKAPMSLDEYLGRRGQVGR